MSTKKAPDAGKGVEGTTKIQGKEPVMSHFTPTREQARKYADYSIEFRDSKLLSRPEVWGCGVVRPTFTAYRYPSTKKFVFYLRAGLSPADRLKAQIVAKRFRTGEWARHADLWFRRKGTVSGRIVFIQERGIVAPDPFAQLELEMMIDADSTVTPC